MRSERVPLCNRWPGLKSTACGVCVFAVTFVAWEYRPEIVLLCEGARPAITAVLPDGLRIVVWSGRDELDSARRLVTVVVRKGVRRWMTPAQPVYYRDEIRLVGYPYDPPKYREPGHGVIAVLAEGLELCWIDRAFGVIEGGCYDGYRIRAPGIRLALRVRETRRPRVHEVRGALMAAGVLD